MAEIPIIGEARAKSDAEAISKAQSEKDAAFQTYRERMLKRWETIERAFQQAHTGLRNDLLALRKAANAREFHALRDQLDDKFLTTTEFLHRAHNGYKD